MNRLRFLSLLPAFSLLQATAAQPLWVLVNNHYKGRLALEITAEQPCLTRALLAEWGVKTTRLPASGWTAQGCLSARIAQQRFHSRYQPDAALLTLTIAAEDLWPRQNDVAASRWDEGISALFTSWRASYRYAQSDNPYAARGAHMALELDNGVNVGPWRLRYQNTFWRDAAGRQGVFTRQASLYRSLHAWRAQWRIGDGETSDTLFDAFPFRGMTLKTDEAMLPDRWRPFSPWVSGYARSHADVTISQNGLTLYRLRVPPGPFVIRDFYPPANDGALLLTIRESDGSESWRYLPWSALPALARRSHVSYELAAGRYRPWRGSDLPAPAFLQASRTQGISAALTLYGGLQRADGYVSYLAGAGLNLNPLGALSVDVTQARYLSASRSRRGEVWRLRYAKAFFTQQTSVSVLLRYFPSRGQYRSLEENILQPDDDWLFDDSENRRLLQAIWINRYFADDRSLSLHYTQQSWRQTRGQRRAFSLSYQATREAWDISLWLGRAREPAARSETTLGITLSLSLPGSGSPTLRYDHHLASRAFSSQEIGLSGSALANYSLRYDAAVTAARHGDRGYQASLSYQHNAGEALLRVAAEGDTRDYQIDASGSLLLHQEGLTFGQAMSETMALIVVPDSPGIGNDQQFGVTTNAKGEALVGYLVPWRVNRLTLDGWQLPEGTTLPMTEREVVPTQGAIVKALYLAAEKQQTAR